MFSWSLPNGFLVLDKRTLSKAEWKRMLKCLALLKDGLVAAEHSVEPTRSNVGEKPAVVNQSKVSQPT